MSTTPTASPKSAVFDATFYMHRALELASAARGRVEPNPMVGAVIVRDGVIMAEAAHERFGEAHAEVLAIQACHAGGVDPAGLTLYVSLEPCTHEGKQPPCVDTIIEAKLEKVVVAMVDPFDKVAGRGIAKLREAGIEVEVGLCETEARELNRGFIKRVETGLPWVTLKWAQTLDGRIATGVGHSQWISCAESRSWVHEKRAAVDAIVVGVGTVVADDPQLTARDVEVRRVARRVVIDRFLKMPPKSRMLHDDGSPVTIAADHGAIEDRSHQRNLDALRETGAHIVPLPLLPDDRPNLRELLTRLVKEHDVTNVLVEGGAMVNGMLLEQGLADQIVAFVAPKVLGDDEAIAAVRGLVCPSIEDARVLHLHEVKRIGEDVLLDYRVGECVLRSSEVA